MKFNTGRTWLERRADSFDWITGRPSMLLGWLLSAIAISQSNEKLLMRASPRDALDNGGVSLLKPIGREKSVDRLQ
jgi:hypothetical protein